VWLDIARWLGVEAPLPNVRVVHLNNFSGLIHGGRVFVLKHTSIWFAAIWKEHSKIKRFSRKICFGGHYRGTY